MAGNRKRASLFSGGRRQVLLGSGERHRRGVSPNPKLQRDEHGRFRAICSCGWRSSWYGNKAQAQQQHRSHECNGRRRGKRKPPSKGRRKASNQSSPEAQKRSKAAKSSKNARRKGARKSGAGSQGRSGVIEFNQSTSRKRPRVAKSDLGGGVADERVLITDLIAVTGVSAQGLLRLCREMGLRPKGNPTSISSAQATRLVARATARE